MILNRRQLLGAAAVLGVTGCGSAPAGETLAATPPPVPIDGPGPLIDWIALNRDNVSLLVDDGRGAVFTHLADRTRPIGSAVKVSHLAAYAQAVAAGTFDPAGPVSVADWERWWVPGSDGGAHQPALESLSVTSEGTVTWDDLAAVMIDFSDNAATDLFRATLGDQALIDAAAAGGWAGLDVPSIAGEALLAGGTVPIEPDRRTQSLAAATAYADGDPTWRAVAATYTQPLPEVTPEDAAAAFAQVVDFYDGAWSATVTQLAALHRAAATDELGGDASAIMRRHLERILAPKVQPGVLGFGQKGGSLPGVLSNAFTVRREDGSVGVSVISLSRLPQQVYLEAPSAMLLLSQNALLDEATLPRVQAAVAE